MATLDEMRQALITAHNSGDSITARQLALSIRLMESQPIGAVPVAQPLGFRSQATRRPLTMGQRVQEFGAGVGRGLETQLTGLKAMGERFSQLQQESAQQPGSPLQAMVFRPAGQLGREFLAGIEPYVRDPSKLVEAGQEMASRATSGPQQAGQVFGEMVDPRGLMTALKAPPVAEMTTYHGTPHVFAPEEGAPLGRFRASQIGTGEGAVAPTIPSAQQVRLGSIDTRNLSPQQAAIAQRSRNLWSSGSAPELVPQLLGPDNTPLNEYFARNPDVKTFVDQNPGIVSTRLPTAVKAQENLNSGNLLIDYSVAKADQKSFDKNIRMMSQYPNFRIDDGMGIDQKAEQMIEQMKSNLLFVHDTMPRNYRDRSHLWYVGARNIVDSWAPKYALPDQAISGVLAVLSPQKDWFQNVSLAERVLDISRNQGNFSWNSKMDAKASEIWDAKYEPILDLVRNKKFGDLESPEEKALWLRTYDQAFNSPEHFVVSPEGNFEGLRLTDSGERRKIAWGSLNEIGKAVAIVDNPEIANISRLLGDMHKVRSFYSNIYAPFDPRGAATIDTHAVAAAMLRPLSGKSREVLHNFGSGIVGEGGPGKNSLLGVNGTYGIILEAYRRAAAERGLLPREMQSITWEGVRGLFPDKWKRPQNAASIDAIWNRYRNGEITLQEAQNEVIQASPNKGTGTPEWARAAK